MEENKDLDIRKQDKLLYSLENVDTYINKSYLSRLSNFKITKQFPIVEDNTNLIDEFNMKIRFFDITQVILNKNENMRDKLVTVFNSVRTSGASLLMHIKGSADKVFIRFGVKNSSDLSGLSLSQEILEKNFRANFPGSILKNCPKNSLKQDILDSFSQDDFVSTVTDIPALRYKEESKERQFMQGIEKLIDTLRGEDYSILLIADPISQDDLKVNRYALENIYSSLVPYSESQRTLGVNESVSLNESISNSVTESINKSVTDSVSHTTGKTTNINLGAAGPAIGMGIASAIAKNAAKAATAGVAAGTVVPGAGNLAGLAIGGAIGAVIGLISFSKSKSDTNSTSETKGVSSSEGTTTTKGTSSSIGTSSSLQIKFENKTVTQIMKRIDETLKRYDTSADLGMWNYSVYCISPNEYVSKMAASVYHSLIRGEKSSLEDGAVTIWNKEQSKEIINSLKHMSHPFFNVDGLGMVTPGTLISSSELAIAAGLPNHSVPGIPVIECAEFGRTVSSYDNSEKTRTITLGNIYNMYVEEKLPVKLDVDSLSSHVFITGSTGSGKSNTVYQLLDSLKQNEVMFLVVEPAKGEYKNVFGQDETDELHCNVHVYGTNPDLSSLLRINPFSFPNRNEDPSKNIHILEHLDRLIEIFNVCWPMYAAMPAVLKEAVEKSYEDCGWNLTESTNEYGNDFYPTFVDVTRNIRTIIDSSEYDSDNKGAYKGSLITRLKSLTNGINGLIFTTDEISNEDLFDENVIVDLSRVGSSETKSLIMGLLVLKLQEYRMTSGAMNSQLRHVTVLEEAHNLLKRTSTEQSAESGNLIGKSVEMLTNSIAEMRTYGEGFIIADQAPALLDMAVIRNTNTKIIMRLPDKNDRELVGKAANLNDDQIIELAKLPRGVAAVYQNEWVEAVLCKVNHFVTKPNQYKKAVIKSEIENKDLVERLQIAQLLFDGIAVSDEVKLKDLQLAMGRIKLSVSSKVMALNYLKSTHEKPVFTKLAPIVSEVFPSVYDSMNKSYSCTEFDTFQWTKDVDKAIRELTQSEINEKLSRRIRQCIITQYLWNDLNKKDALEKWAKEGGLR